MNKLLVGYTAGVDKRQTIWKARECIRSEVFGLRSQLLRPNTRTSSPQNAQIIGKFAQQAARWRLWPAKHFRQISLFNVLEACDTTKQQCGAHAKYTDGTETFHCASRFALHVNPRHERSCAATTHRHKNWLRSCLTWHTQIWMSANHLKTFNCHVQSAFSLLHYYLVEKYPRIRIFYTWRY